MNSQSDNIDVYNLQQPSAIRSLDIESRQMNCSVLTKDDLFVGTRDRRIFIFNKFTLDAVKVIEVPESVHCMAVLSDCTQIAVGMTDGHILLLGSPEDQQNEDYVVRDDNGKDLEI